GRVLTKEQSGTDLWIWLALIGGLDGTGKLRTRPGQMKGRRRGISMATILIDKNVLMPMRDGVRLATDVYRLEGAPPEPVLLARTPYDKEHIIAASNAFDILRAVQAGYVVVIQDV